MAFSNNDLTRELNLVLKALQDLVLSNKMNGSNNTMKDMVNSFSRSANSVGSDSKRFAQMLDKLLKRMEGLGVNEAKASLLLREITKGNNMDVGKMEKLMSPDQLNNLFNTMLKKIKDSPVSLNNKENISLISKAIAKGNRDYASTGFGKVESDFYANATKKQIKELSRIREGLADPKRENNLLKLASGLAVGAVGNVSDILLKNAGFGELPSQMMDVIKSANNIWDSFKNKKNETDNSKNAMTVEAYKNAEASYAEIRRKNESTKKIIKDAESSKQDMVLELASSFSNALAKTSFGDKRKENYLKKLSDGTLDNKEINAIINDWKKTLGSAITQDDLDMMKSFYIATKDGMADIKESEDLIIKTKERHIQSINQENDALINATKLKEQTDNLMLKEIEAKKKEIDKRVNKVGKHLSPEIKESLANNQLLQATNDIKKKWGIEDSESKGLFTDNRVRYKNNLVEAGATEVEAENKIKADASVSELLEYNTKLNEKLKKISSIFDIDEITPTRITRTPPRNGRFVLPPVIGPNPPNPPNGPINPPPPKMAKHAKSNSMSLSQNPHISPPNNQNQTTPSIKTTTPKRQSGLNQVSPHSEYIKKQYDLMLAIYGKDGSKFAESIANKISNKVLKVHVVNWPNGGASSGGGGVQTTPP